MRHALLCAALALTLVACGSGSGLALTTAALQGNVYEVDGQSLDLSGVEVTIVETGQVAFTDAAGDFEIDGLRPGAYTLDFDASLNTGAQLAGNFGLQETEDEDGRPIVDVPADGGVVEVRVKIEDGEVTDYSMGHYEERHARAWLHLTDAAEIAGYRLEGKVAISASEHGERFEVCVYGLEPGQTVSLCIRLRESDELVSIGEMTADGDGRACYVRESGNLPLDAESLDQLAGLALFVKDGEGTRLMVAELPDLPEKMERPEEGDGNDGVGENDEGDGNDEAGENDEGDGNDEAGENDEAGDDAKGTDGDGSDENGEAGASDGEGDTDGVGAGEGDGEGDDKAGDDATDGTSEDGDDNSSSSDDGEGEGVK